MRRHAKHTHTISMLEALIVAIAAFFAGFVDSIVGGRAVAAGRGSMR
jgi:F0F1-type ATP synthase membrane subunit c/vacuolar-type H+-ATPase subunit K